MKKIWVQLNKYENSRCYTLNAISNVKQEHAIFVEITQDDLNEIQEMLNELEKEE